MADDMNQLRAQVEAQSCVIELLLVTCMRHGILAPHALSDVCRTWRDSPTFVAADPRAKRLVLKELEALADLLIDQHLADTEPQDA